MGKEKWFQGNKLTLVLRDEELKAGSVQKVRQQRRALAEATWKKKKDKNQFLFLFIRNTQSLTPWVKQR